MVFGKNYSTAYVLIQLNDKLSDVIDQGKLLWVYLLTYPRLSTSVNLDILLAKLKFYGVRGRLHYSGSKVIFLVELNMYSKMA